MVAWLHLKLSTLCISHCTYTWITISHLAPHLNCTRSCPQICFNKQKNVTRLIIVVTILVVKPHFYQYIVLHLVWGSFVPIERLPTESIFSTVVSLCQYTLIKVVFPAENTKSFPKPSQPQANRSFKSQSTGSSIQNRCLYWVLTIQNLLLMVEKFRCIFS